MISKASTSIMPRSEILRCGITGSGRKASCRKGSSSVPPSAFRGLAQRDQLSRTVFIGLVAHQAGHRQGDLGNTLPFSATTKPPRISLNRLAATAISASVAPTTQMLWLSWPMVEAMAPRLRPKP
jgi:hypothetical protein